MSLLYSPRWSQILELQNCSIRPGLESSFLVTFLSIRGRVIYKEAYDITWVPEELIVTLGNVGYCWVKLQGQPMWSWREICRNSREALALSSTNHKKVVVNCGRRALWAGAKGCHKCIMQQSSCGRFGGRGGAEAASEQEQKERVRGVGRACLCKRIQLVHIGRVIGLVAAAVMVSHIGCCCCYVLLCP